MPTVGTSSKPAYVYDAGTDTWIPIGPGEHTHDYAASAHNHDSTYVAKTLTTTTGDIIYASAANTPARLGIGSSGQVLSVSGGVPVWAAAGTAFETYTNFTPNQINFTLGNGTLNYCRYAQSGKLVHYNGKITWGSTTSITGTWELQLPVYLPIRDMGYGGTAFYYDNSTGASYGGLVYLGSGGTSYISFSYDIASQSNWGVINGGTVPFTWASGDIITWNVLYQAG